MFTGQFKKETVYRPGNIHLSVGYGCWPTTSVWAYHDHSIYDMENVNLGAIGVIVIHNAAEAGDVGYSTDS